MFICLVNPSIIEISHIQAFGEISFLNHEFACIVIQLVELPVWVVYKPVRKKKSHRKILLYK